MQLILRNRSQKRWLIPLLFIAFVCISFNIGKWQKRSMLASSTPATAVPVSTKAASEGKFSVITYNVAGLPEIISSAVTSRASSMAEIGQRLNNYDIVHVQEDFNYNTELYGRNNHPYRSMPMGPVPFGDGLNTLSKFPISDVERVEWADCTGADCLTPKGFTRSRIQIAEAVYIDFYNVHANASNHPSAAAARCKNIHQLSRYIKTHSGNNAVIVMGDMNAHYCFKSDNIKDLLAENSLNDAWVVLNQKGQFPKVMANLPEDNILSLTDTCESIDKILFRNSKQILLTPGYYQVPKALFSDEEGRPLSDHHPVSLSFFWKLKDKELALNVLPGSHHSN